MTHHTLALANVLTFLLEHHAEHVDFLSLRTGAGGAVECTIFLSQPPRGATMLGWEWEPSSILGKIVHVTPSGITIHAPEFTR